MKLPRIDFSLPSYEVAPQLIGCEFYVDGVGGVIVEVEAYGQSEAASHTFSGPSMRNASMFGSPEGHGAGILIRAIQPAHGLDIMRARRGVDRLLCSGPGRVGQALDIVHAFNGRSLAKKPFKLLPAATPVDVVHGPRIGISKAMDFSWRFGLAGSPFLSKPFC